MGGGGHAADLALGYAVAALLLLVPCAHGGLLLLVVVVLQLEYDMGGALVDVGSKAPAFLPGRVSPGL